MKEVNELIYNELVEMRKDFNIYMEHMDKRVSVLEAFKNKLVGAVLLIGVCIGYVIDYLKGKVM